MYSVSAGSPEEQSVSLPGRPAPASADFLIVFCFGPLRARRRHRFCHGSLCLLGALSIKEHRYFWTKLRIDVFQLVWFVLRTEALGGARLRQTLPDVITLQVVFFQKIFARA